MPSDYPVTNPQQQAFMQEKYYIEHVSFAMPGSSFLSSANSSFLLHPPCLTMAHVAYETVLSECVSSEVISTIKRLESQLTQLWYGVLDNWQRICHSSNSIAMSSVP